MTLTTRSSATEKAQFNERHRSGVFHSKSAHGQEKLSINMHFIVS